MPSLTFEWITVTPSCPPRTVTDKLQGVLNAATRVITGTRKFDRGLTARPTVLARRSFQACSDSSRSPVSQRPRNTVSVGALTRGGICVPPTVTCLPYRVSGSTLTAVGRSQLLARWPGTHSRILSGIQRAAQTVLRVYLKRNCSRVTSASSALGVLNDYALYTNPRTHSVTHSRLFSITLIYIGW